MRKLRVSVLVAGLMVVGAACSSSGDGGSAGSAAPAGDGTTAVSEAPVTDASVAPTDTAAPTPPAGGDAACLQGTWLQGPARLQGFLDQIGSPLAMSVQPDSLMTLTMSGDSVSVVSTITLQVVAADTTMQMTGNGNYSGTFSADGGSIDVVLASQEYTAGDWMITIDGNSVSAPGMTPVDPGPPINGIGTYTCSDTTLEVVASGRTSVFDRA
ncbi:MAG: hypothetical protein ABMA25_01820 [Ilumatobacteraceae bacterium]